jgi:Replicative DNA helicase
MNNTAYDRIGTDLTASAVMTEQALLGTLLLFPSKYIGAASILKPEYFVEPIHQYIYSVFEECRQSGLEGTLLDVIRTMGDKAEQILEGKTVKEYTIQLQGSSVGTLFVEKQSKDIREYWILRQMAGSVAKASRGGIPAEQVSSIFEEFDKLRSLRADEGCSSADIETLCMEVAEEAAKIAMGDREEPGLTTGLPKLDDAILGFRPGELVIVAGRPGMGKSTVATSLALAASRTAKGGRTGGIGFLGLELGKNAIGSRLLADICSDHPDAPSHSNIRSGKIERHQIDIMANARDRMREHSLIIDYRSSASVSDIESVCRSWKQKFEEKGQRLDAIFIDYIKQVKSSDRYRGNRVYEIGEITAGLRDIAKRLQLCVILLVQLNRDVEKRDNKRPSLADLRESGDIENDADVVMMIYREAYYLKKELAETTDCEKWTELNSRLRQTENTVEILITKNRNGEGNATISAACDIAHSAIRPLHEGEFSNG